MSDNSRGANLARPTRRGRLMPLPILLTALLPSARAHAAEVGADTATNKVVTSLSYCFGLGTPVGVNGLELQVKPIPWVSLAAGVGQGSGGVQGAAMLRGWVSPAADRGRFYLGAGASGGNYRWEEFCIDCRNTAEKQGLAIWQNNELGFELRSKSGRFLTRFYTGIAIRVAGSLACTHVNDLHCRRDHARDPAWLPYLGSSWGVAFW